jgi:hypothetical protein
MHEKLWGADHFIAWTSLRYCLGRRTYVVSKYADWLIANWADIQPNVQRIIERDVEDEFRLDDLARESGATYRPLGDDCDRKEWERVRGLWTPRG